MILAPHLTRVYSSVVRFLLLRAIPCSHVREGLKEHPSLKNGSRGLSCSACTQLAGGRLQWSTRLQLVVPLHRLLSWTIQKLLRKASGPPSPRRGRRVAAWRAATPTAPTAEVPSHPVRTKATGTISDFLGAGLQNARHHHPTVVVPLTRRGAGSPSARAVIFRSYTWYVSRLHPQTVQARAHLLGFLAHSCRFLDALSYRGGCGGRAIKRRRDPLVGSGMAYRYYLVCMLNDHRILT